MDPDLIIASVILGTSLVFQYWAAGISFSLIREVEYQKSWLLIALAITLMALRRTVSFIAMFRADHAEPPNVSAEIIALATSVLLLMGLRLMQPYLSRLQDGYETMILHTKKVYEMNCELERFNSFVSRSIHVPCRLAASSARHLEHSVQADLREDDKKHLQTIVEQSQKIKDLADKLLLHANANSRSYLKETINLSEIAESIATQLRKQYAEREITFEIEEEIFVEADPVLLRGAVENLMDIAVKSVPETVNPLITIGTGSRTKGQKYIFVRDNGLSLDELEQQNIIKPFFNLRTYRDIDGPGLGLSVAASIIRSHNGKIWAEQNKDGGNTVCFTLVQEV